MRSAASRDTDVTKQNNLYIKLQHSSAASLFRTSLEIGQNLHSTAKLRMMFAQLHQFKKLNSILYIIRNTLLKICILPAPPEVCYATPRGVTTPSLGSPGLSSSLRERFKANPSFFASLSFLPPNDPSNIDQIESLYALGNLANEVRLWRNSLSAKVSQESLSELFLRAQVCVPSPILS